MGALFGKLGKTGIDKQVLEQMGDAVPPGKAGWFLLIGQMTEDKFLAAVEGTQRDAGALQPLARAGGAAQGGLRHGEARQGLRSRREATDARGAARAGRPSLPSVYTWSRLAHGGRGVDVAEVEARVYGAIPHWRRAGPRSGRGGCCSSG